MSNQFKQAAKFDYRADQNTKNLLPLRTLSIWLRCLRHIVTDIKFNLVPLRPITRS